MGTGKDIYETRRENERRKERADRDSEDLVAGIAAFFRGDATVDIVPRPTATVGASGWSITFLPFRKANPAPEQEGGG